MMLHRFVRYLLHNQIIFALFLVASAWFLIEIRDILVSIFLSYIIMAAVEPAVGFLQERKFPKTLAVLIPYLSIICAIFLLVLPLVPFVFSQISILLARLPSYIDSSSTVFGVSLDRVQIQRYLDASLKLMSSNAFDFTKQVFGGLFSMITLLVTKK